MLLQVIKSNYKNNNDENENNKTFQITSVDWLVIMANWGGEM